MGHRGLTWLVGGFTLLAGMGQVRVEYQTRLAPRYSVQRLEVAEMADWVLAARTDTERVQEAGRRRLLDEGIGPDPIQMRREHRALDHRPDPGRCRVVLDGDALR